MLLGSSQGAAQQLVAPDRLIENPSVAIFCFWAGFPIEQAGGCQILAVARACVMREA